MDQGPRQPRRRTQRAHGTWYWCAPCSQGWQPALIPLLHAEGCPLCGGDLVPMLGRGTGDEDPADAGAH